MDHAGRVLGGVVRRDVRSGAPGENRSHHRVPHVWTPRGGRDSAVSDGVMGRKEDFAARAIRNRKIGRCGCGRPLPPKAWSCAPCTSQMRDLAKARRKLPGHCSGCGKECDQRVCSMCRTSKRSQKARQRQRRRDAGVCVRCARPVEKPGATRCAVHADQARASSNDYYQRNKMKERKR